MKTPSSTRDCSDQNRNCSSWFSVGSQHWGLSWQVHTHTGSALGLELAGPHSYWLSTGLACQHPRCEDGAAPCLNQSQRWISQGSFHTWCARYALHHYSSQQKQCRRLRIGAMHDSPSVKKACETGAGVGLRPQGGTASRLHEFWASSSSAVLSQVQDASAVSSCARHHVCYYDFQ